MKEGRKLRNGIIYKKERKKGRIEENIKNMKYGAC
jgi:hypothetical protein